MSGMIDALIATARKHLAVDELDLAELRLKEAVATLEAEFQIRGLNPERKMGGVAQAPPRSNLQ
jgi:hypothetical protein